MSTKTFIFLIILLVNISYEIGGSCNDKMIVSNEGGNEYSLVAEEATDFYLQSDYKRAFYKSASCGTLNTQDNANYLCCYMKVRYKLDAAKSHYTSRGCVEVSFTNLQNEDNFDSMRKGYEDGIKSYYANNEASTVSDIDVDIDCYSKFIKFTTLAFLMLLL